MIYDPIKQSHFQAFNARAKSVPYHGGTVQQIYNYSPADISRYVRQLFHQVQKMEEGDQVNMEVI